LIKYFKKNQENSEIFSPDDLNQFQFSPSDKKLISTQPIAADLETEPTVPKVNTTEKVAVPKTSKKRGPRGPCKKNPNNNFLTQLNYYIIIYLFYLFINMFPS
jgi:hypothetical protein